jgi:hypothetical protein
MKKNKRKTIARRPTRKTSAATKTIAAKTARPESTVALKATVLKGKPLQAELHHIPWSSVEVEALNPLLGRHFVVGQNVMLARVLLKKGCVVPEHSHHNEQITYVLECGRGLDHSAQHAALGRGARGYRRSRYLQPASRRLDQ